MPEAPAQFSAFMRDAVSMSTTGTETQEPRVAKLPQRPRETKNRQTPITEQPEGWLPAMVQSPAWPLQIPPSPAASSNAPSKDSSSAGFPGQDSRTGEIPGSATARPISATANPGSAIVSPVPATVSPASAPDPQIEPDLAALEQFPAENASFVRPDSLLARHPPVDSYHPVESSDSRKPPEVQPPATESAVTGSPTKSQLPDDLGVVSKDVALEKVAVQGRGSDGLQEKSSDQPPAKPEENASHFGGQVALDQRLEPMLRDAASSGNQSGMSAALMETTMQNVQEEINLASTGGQILPGSTARIGSGRTRKGSGVERSVEDAANSLRSADTAPASTHRPASGLEAAHAGNSPHADSLEAIYRSIESANARLENRSPGSVSVTVNPDEDTRLALHLKYHNGRVEAVAVLERGDFSALGRDWNQLQERLADQGVRLAPLVADPRMAGSSYDHGPQSHPHEPAFDQADDSPTNKPKSAPRHATATATGSARSREWWA